MSLEKNNTKQNIGESFIQSGLQAYEYSDYLRLRSDYKKSNPYAVRVTGRCGMILHIPRHDPF